MYRLSVSLRGICRLQSAVINYPTATSRTLAAVASHNSLPDQTKLNVKPTDLFGQDELMDKMKKHSHKKQIKTFMEPQFFEDRQVVYTTGIKGKINGKACCRIGVFWSTDDSGNIYREAEDTGESYASTPMAELEAVITALRQAQHDKNLNRVIVKTDSEYVANCANTYLKKWRANGFVKKDGKPVKNIEYLKELDRQMSTMDTKIIHEELKYPLGNVVLDMLRTDKEISPKIEKDEEMLEPDIKITKTPENQPVVYASGTVKTSEDGFVIAGYGVHWPQEKDLDKCGRYTDFPLTEFRSKLSAIVHALEIAVDQKMPKVHIVTDSDRFIRFYRHQWRKIDGNPMANFPFYNKIKELEKSVKATYAYLPSDGGNTQIEQALVLAEDGLAYPTKIQIAYQEKRKNLLKEKKKRKETENENEKQNNNYDVEF